MRNRHEIEKQSDFCLDLMLKLKDAIYSSEESGYNWGLENYTQRQQDIIRLRRELMTLSKALNPWGSK